MALNSIHFGLSTKTSRRVANWRYRLVKNQINNGVFRHCPQESKNRNRNRNRKRQKQKEKQEELMANTPFAFPTVPPQREINLFIDQHFYFSVAGDASPVHSLRVERHHHIAILIEHDKTTVTAHAANLFDHSIACILHQSFPYIPSLRKGQ